MNAIHKAAAALFTAAGVTGNIEFTTPPNPAMGDLAFGCFAIAKEQGKSPVEIANGLKEAIAGQSNGLVDSVDTAGPYVNITLSSIEVARIMQEALAKKEFGSSNLGENKKILIEYACPNPLKAFHLGHLKNLITGEAVVRTMENAGYDVMRVNYQGDVGMHVAKALWGINDWIDEFEQVKEKSLRDRVEFLGKAYAHGAQHFEKGEDEKQEVIVFNDKVYERAEDIQAVYQEARTWSLEYFDSIYARLGTKFDKFFFESEMYEEGVTIVNEFLEKGVFKKSDGAVIFEGSKHGLHDRVFINSKGFPTYEAKDVALAHAHMKLNPEKVIHVVGKEQTEYFKVVFKALETVLPESKGKEMHLPGGFLQLKGGKMSSRLGNIVTGDALLDQVTERIAEIMAESTVENKEVVIERVAAASLKYTMLHADVSKDVSFDLEASVSTSGDSGPYLLYIVARIGSILTKAGTFDSAVLPEAIAPQEKALLLQLAQFPAVSAEAALQYDPSKITRYLFDLAQLFNKFYDACPVLDAEERTKAFRLQLASAVQGVMKKGLYILGIETVEQM
ncbi:MAG: arginine--tRNA ligase [Candidatus Magasanikbacteria bacterium]|jgi:arginyl-tRNA synthetase|nr:arginine--tRNA ligase [Candidatus Magasanikbacteria bacterium]